MASPFSNISLSISSSFHSPADKWIRGLARNIDPDAFGLKVFANGIDAALAADARSFIAAEWRHITHGAIRIDPHRSRFEPLRHHQRPAYAGRPYSRSKPVDGAVRDAYGLVFVVEGNDRKNRPEDFLAGH